MLQKLIYMQGYLQSDAGMLTIWGNRPGKKMWRSPFNIFVYIVPVSSMVLAGMLAFTLGLEAWVALVVVCLDVLLIIAFVLWWRFGRIRKSRVQWENSRHSKGSSFLNVTETHAMVAEAVASCYLIPVSKLLGTDCSDSLRGLHVGWIEPFAEELAYRLYLSCQPELELEFFINIIVQDCECKHRDLNKLVEILADSICGVQGVAWCPDSQSPSSSQPGEKHNDHTTE